MSKTNEKLAIFITILLILFISTTTNLIIFLNYPYKYFYTKNNFKFEFDLLKFTLIVFYNLLVLSITFNYYKSIVTFSFVPIDFLSDLICTKCNQSKPTRTHHCSVCNKCITRMDHQ